jgi:hypothetical protein
MPEPWKFLCQSVRGTSHGQSGQPCQDYAFATAVHAGEETILLVTCADGAGSAGHSDIGSKLACENMISRIGAELDSGLSIGEIDQFRFLRWYGEVRSFPCVSSPVLCSPPSWVRIARLLVRSAMV